MMNRRQLIRGSAGTILLSALPLSAFATEEDVQAAIKEIFGERQIYEDRVTLKLPPIAENGYSVPLRINVQSPMSGDDHVRQIAVFAPRNPIPVLAQFHLSPANGQATVSTRIRMGGTQRILAIAEMSDGSLWSGGAETLVTLAACVVL
ncbi:MAG: thiosulfate oxidation carrier protein SoxY [Pseudomonadota bacterium]